MKKNYWQRLFTKSIVSIVIFSILFSAIAPNIIYAQGYPVMDTQLITLTFGDQIKAKKDVVWKNMFYAMIRNGLNAVLGKLAYDAATWIAAGGTGQQSLVFNKKPADYALDLADSAAGGAIDAFAAGTGWDAASICKPSPELNLRIGLSLEGYGPTTPYKPTCTASEMFTNVQSLATDPKFADYVDVQFGPQVNPLGQAMMATATVDQAKKAAEQAAELERLAPNDYKSKTEPISGYILTPGKTVENMFGSQVERANSTNFQVWGQPLADSLSIFMNTLTSKLAERIRNGIANLGQSSDLSSLIAGTTGGTTSGVTAANAIYASLNQPNFITSGSYDIVSELSSCPDQGANSINCVLGSTMQVAITNKWTVQEYLDYMQEVQGNSEFKFAQEDISSPEEGITYRGILVLKQYRIVPVGWQLAAEFIRSEQTTAEATLKQVADCYDYCGGDVTSDKTCDFIYDDGDSLTTDTFSPFCSLVDPNWVLKAPENYCEKQAPGNYVISDEFTDTDGSSDTLQTRNLVRTDYCADNRGCIAEEKENVCTAYGYCSKEERNYRMDADVCQESEASCEAFTPQTGENAGETVSYLKNDLNYDNCATDPGCKWYCQAKDSNGSFICKNQNTVYDVCDSSDSTYYTDESCSCNVEETCWVNPGSGGAEVNTYRSCTLDSGATCTLDDNCGSSNVTYSISEQKCLCTAANTCNIDIDTDGVSPYTASSCTYTYDGGETVNCDLGENCGVDTDTYTSQGYCSASSIGDNCNVQPGLASCVNDLGNTCNLSSGVCGDETNAANVADSNGDLKYCSCSLVADTCEISEGSYYCTSESGNKVILGTKPETDIAPENTDLVYNASINFDNNLEECDAEDASCSAMIRIKPDTNLLYNSAFNIIQGTTDDTSQDYFGAYALTGNACYQDDAAAGSCIGWQQSGISAYGVTTGADTSLYSTLSNDYATSIIIPIKSADTNGITNIFDTGESLANRSFTFAFQAASLSATDAPVKFKIGTSDDSTSITIPDGITVEANKANYEYFTDANADGTYDPLYFSTDYTNYYYTYTFPSTVTSSEIKVTIYASTGDFAVSIAQLNEAESWSGNFSKYGENNLTYFKTAGHTCDTADIGCELYSPQDQENAADIPAQITNPKSAVCGNGEDFSDPNCNQCDGLGEQAVDYYVGCDFYQEMPLDNNTPISDYQSYLAAPAELLGVAQRTGYYCSGTQTSCYPGDSDGTCAALSKNCENTVSLIPDTGESCSASDVGCEEYTNLDAVSAGGEGLEYYSYIRPCVKTNDTNTYTYHTWEGSDTEGYAMVLYNLKKSDAGIDAAGNSAPCTNLDLSQQSVAADCIDSTSTVEDCSTVYGIDPDCVKYYDDNLNVYYRYQSKTISVSDECVPMRSTLDQRVYYSILNESSTCDVSKVGCREYQGSAAGDVMQLINESFSANSTASWTGAYSTSNESLYTDDYSLRLDSGTTDEDSSLNATTPSNFSYNLYTASTDASGTVTNITDVASGATYLLNFWAKGSGILNVYLTGASSGANYYFTENGFSTDSADANINITDSEWRYYILGPINLPTTESIDTPVLHFTYTSSDANTPGYIDNIILEKNSSQYLLKGSFDTCYNYEGCRRYQDREKNTHYLKSFNRMCEDYNVGCEAIINTANSLNTEFTTTFLTSNEYTNDDVTVPYDQVQSLIYNDDYQCSGSAKGCSALGLPDINEQTNVINAIETKYGLVDPDNFETLLCEDPQLDCREYSSKYDGTVYFKDPGDRLCEYKSYVNSDGVTTYGWFITNSTATTPDCPKQYDYADPSQPYGPICNSNSQTKAGKRCNNDADCYPDSWVSGNPTPRCISSIWEDIDQWDGAGSCSNGISGNEADCTTAGATWAYQENHFADDGYSIDRNLNFGWVGTCNEDVSGCSEYIDPNSPNIEELLTNRGFEDNVKNNIVDQYFGASDLAVAENLPDYWKPVDDSGAIAWNGSDTDPNDGSAEYFSQDPDIFKEGTNSLKITNNVDIMSSDPISVDRDKLYTFELFFKISSDAQYTDDADTYYKKLKIGAKFYKTNSTGDGLEEVASTDDQKYFVANDLTVTSSNYTEDATQLGYSNWMHLSGNIGLGSTVEIPAETTVIKLFMKVDSEGTSSTDDVWFDDLSFKENDKYYLIDYTVDGTTERESFDNIHTCIDQNTEEEAVTSDGGCVAFRDTSTDSEEYIQFVDGICNGCAITPNNDTCRYIINACDTNSILKVKKDRVCSQWIACDTAAITTDASGNQKTTCFSIAPCEKMNDQGQCTKWEVDKRTKPTYDELDENSDLTYYVHSGDADQLYKIQNLTGYVKAGLTWGDYKMCQDGWNDGGRCSTDDECLDQGECQATNKFSVTEGVGDADPSVLTYNCVGGSHNGDSCMGSVSDGGMAIVGPDSTKCVGDEDGTCSGTFTIPGYYPYGWMYEAGTSGSDNGEEMIEFGNFENLYCQGDAIPTDIPCIFNSYDTDKGATTGHGNCWQTSFDALIENDSASETGDTTVTNPEKDNPIEGNPYQSAVAPAIGMTGTTNMLNSADFYCPNSPAFEDFPFGGGAYGTYTDHGWSGYNTDNANVYVTQYDNEYGANLEADINNVLEVNPQATMPSSTEFNAGVQYDLKDSIQQGGMYSLSFKGRFADTYSQLGGDTPSLISIGLKTNNIINSDTGQYLDKTDWFVNGNGSVDIVFIVDTSDSMENEIASLNSALAGFAQTLQDAKLDVQFAIVTMDKENGIDADHDGAAYSGSWSARCLDATNMLYVDLTDDIASLTSKLSSLNRQYVRVDPFAAVQQVINNDLPYFSPSGSATSPTISYRAGSQKYIMVLSDTGDEWGTADMDGNGTCGDNGVPNQDFYNTLSGSGTTVYTITNPTTDSGVSLTSHYADLASYSGGEVYTELSNADWSSTNMISSIEDDIINNRQYFQFNQELQQYALGPITIQNRLPCTTNCTTPEAIASGKALTTDLVFVSNDGAPFQIDDVSLLPALEVNKELPLIARSCRAYPNSNSVECSSTETSGVQHKGWQGYCLEADPDNANRCITWWPLDIISGEGSLYTKEHGGYSERANVYDCLVAKGYERVGFCADDTDKGEGQARRCEPSSDELGLPSNDCDGGSCFMGSEYNLDHNGSYDSSYSPSRVESGGTCNSYDDLANSCFNYPTGSVYEEGDSEVDDGIAAVGDSIPYEINNYLSSASCITDEDDPDGLGDISHCYFDFDNDGIDEIKSDIQCASNSFCQSASNINETDYGAAVCTPYRCSGGSENTPCNISIGCPMPEPISDYSNNYVTQTRKWAAPNPYNALEDGGYHWGAISRLPANVTEKNINISEMEDIYLYLGKAGSGSGGTDETKIWNQDQTYGPDENPGDAGWVNLTDLMSGAMDFTDGKQVEKCRAINEGQAKGFACLWWGQFDSQGDLSKVNNSTDVTDESKYDLVYTYAYSAWDSGGEIAGGVEGVGQTGDNCDNRTDSDGSEPYEHYTTLVDKMSSTDSSENRRFMDANCTTGLIRRITRWTGNDGQGTHDWQFSNVENNPWKELAKSDTGAAALDNLQTHEVTTIDPEDFPEYYDAWPNMISYYPPPDTIEIDPQVTGGNILSVWLDFDASGYLQNIYTMVYGGAEFTEDTNNVFEDIGEAIGVDSGASGKDVTNEKMMALQYQLREPCAVVVNTVDNSGNNTAWASRASGNGAASFAEGGFNYTDVTSPWGSISAIDETFGPMWDTFNDTEGDNVYNPTTWGQQPIFIWSPSENYIQGGTPYSCIGSCGTKWCVGNWENLHQSCEDSGDCGEYGVCVGTDTGIVSAAGLTDHNGHSHSQYYDGTSSSQVAQTGNLYAGQYHLKHIFADILDNPYYVDFTTRDSSEYGIYRVDSNSDNESIIWNKDVYNNMSVCPDNTRPVEDTDIGTDSEYCGVRPTLEDVAIDGNTTGGTYAITSGQTVQLSFTSTADVEQTELRKVYIEWGDGQPLDQNWDAMPGSHVYTHAYSCAGGVSNGAYDYVAGVGCYYIGTITVVDNWGWCSGDTIGTCDYTNNINGSATTVYDAALTDNDCNLRNGAFASGSDHYRYNLATNDSPAANVKEGCNSYNTFPFVIKVTEE